jgi:glutamate-1-semialdehyde 2,1-aminomutase
MTANSALPGRERLTELLHLERRTFTERNPRSRALFDRAKQTLLNGVPMSWMSCWAGGFPVFVAEASGARVTDVDGHAYVDFCLGDTGAFAGHAAGATAEAIRARFARGATTMLPTEDAAWVGAELARRFGLPVWQFSLTATDANRWVLRLARELTGRVKILVFNGCYHGTVDETVIELDRAGRPAVRPGNAGAAFNPAQTTEVIEFNDIPALERALRTRAIACVLSEPALTNAAGIIPPQPGYHQALRELTASTGTYLILDETQTFPAGPGGYTGEHGLSPDFLTIGKAIAGGVPLGAYGMRREIADAITAAKLDMGDVGAFGGTLAGNALSLAAARATLANVLTDEAHRRMNGLGARFAAGVKRVITSRGLPWHIVQLGARLEYRYSPDPPRNATESADAMDEELDAYLHLYLLNRGMLMTPFHNMALMSPATQEADIDHHTGIFAEAVEELLKNS